MESPHLHDKLVSAGPKTISVGEFVRSGIKFSFLPINAAIAGAAMKLSDC